MNVLQHVLRKPNRIISRTLSAFPITENSESKEEVDKLYRIVEVEVRGNDPAVLRSFSKFAVTTGNHLDIDTKSWTLRKPSHERYTVLKSAHIYKKHRVQYEVRTYYSFIQYKHLTGSTADTLLEYIERNLPEGVALKATKLKNVPLSIWSIMRHTYNSPNSLTIFVYSKGYRKFLRATFLGMVIGKTMKGVEFYSTVGSAGFFTKEIPSYVFGDELIFNYWDGHTCRPASGLLTHHLCKVELQELPEHLIPPDKSRQSHLS